MSGTEAAALLATEQGQSFRRKFKGDFEETEGFCDSQGKFERFSTNNSLPGMAHVVVSRLPFILLFIIHSSLFIIPFCIVVDAAESVGVSTSSTDGSCMSSNPAGFINASHQAGVRSISSTICTVSRTNAPGTSIQSTTNPALEKSVNAGRKQAESRRTRDSSMNNSLPGMAHVVFKQTSIHH